MRKELKKKESSAKKKNRSRINRVYQVANQTSVQSQNLEDLQSHLQIGTSKIRVKNEYLEIHLKLQVVMMNQSQSKNFKTKKNLWDFQKELGSLKEVSKVQYSQILFNKCRKQVEILTLFKEKTKRLGKRVRWRGLNKSLNNQQPVFINQIFQVNNIHRSSR